ncbi:uncharacterized protein MYCFIDRAFT_171821 [Pseudocercospora fijiensis CIRAD86]|uniref:Uncharacterized protein n=1 Tax=Pseudocercospora fijiensis (strain CIRAD86) TaxID=383855 RepID=M3A4E5_PSEFD|nr:uncharacterized protein MYCFIDRAFT_171821 [Pseudocercospora fijiensis CIRAD86]EME85989.1 hypothetical protein MYCFIDRAFT_171821 [Pseudocercospora fijiensis CIRAD86]
MESWSIAWSNKVQLLIIPLYHSPDPRVTVAILRAKSRADCLLKRAVSPAAVLLALALICLRAKAPRTTVWQHGCGQLPPRMSPGEWANVGAIRDHDSACVLLHWSSCRSGGSVALEYRAHGLVALEAGIITDPWPLSPHYRRCSGEDAIAGQYLEDVDRENLGGNCARGGFEIVIPKLESKFCQDQVWVLTPDWD